MGLGESTCYGRVEVLEVHLLVGPLAASQTSGKDSQVLGQGPLHVLCAAAEIPTIVELHGPEEHGLEGSVVGVRGTPNTLLLYKSYGGIWEKL